MTSLSFSPSPRLRPRLDRLYALWHEKNEGTIRTMLFQEIVEKLAEQVNYDQQWQGFLKNGEEKRGVQVSWGKSERKDVILHDADVPWDSFRAKPAPENAEGLVVVGLPSRMLDRLERHLAWAQRWVQETHPADIPAEWAAKRYASFEEWFGDEVEKYVDRELSKLEEQQEKDEVAELYPELARNREKNKPPPPPPRAPPAQAPPPPAPGGPKWEPPFAGRSVNPHAPHRRGPQDR